MCLYEPGPVTNAYIKSNVANTIMKNYRKIIVLLSEKKMKKINGV